MYIGNGGLVGTMVVWTVLWRRQWGFVICGTVSFRVESWAGLVILIRDVDVLDLANHLGVVW